MALTKKEKMDAIRNEVIGTFAENLTDLTQVDSGSFIAVKEDAEGNEVYVEVKFIVKGDTFDFEDAITAFEDKKKKAEERETARVKKAEESAKKKAEAEAKKKAKESKQDMRGEQSPLFLYFTDINGKIWEARAFVK